VLHEKRHSAPGHEQLKVKQGIAILYNGCFNTSSLCTYWVPVYNCHVLCRGWEP